MRLREHFGQPVRILVSIGMSLVLSSLAPAQQASYDPHKFMIARSHYTKAMKLLADNRLSDGEAELLEAVKTFPQLVEGYVELGNLSTRRDYIHTSDMARAISQLMACQTGGFDVFNIGSGKSFYAGEIIQFFERAINESLIVDVATDRVRKVDRALLQADITKIYRAIGWTPEVEIQQGIAALVQGEASLVSR